MPQCCTEKVTQLIFIAWSVQGLRSTLLFGLSRKMMKTDRSILITQIVAKTCLSPTGSWIKPVVCRSPLLNLNLGTTHENLDLLLLHSTPGRPWQMLNSVVDSSLRTPYFLEAAHPVVQLSPHPASARLCQMKCGQNDYRIRSSAAQRRQAGTN